MQCQSTLFLLFYDLLLNIQFLGMQFRQKPRNFRGLFGEKHNLAVFSTPLFCMMPLTTLYKYEARVPANLISLLEKSGFISISEDGIFSHSTLLSWFQETPAISSYILLRKMSFFQLFTELKIGQKFIEKWQIWRVQAKACGQKVLPGGMTLHKYFIGQKLMENAKIKDSLQEIFLTKFDNFLGLLEIIETIC